MLPFLLLLFLPSLALSAPLAHYGLNHSAAPDNVAANLQASELTFSTNEGAGYSSLAPIEGSHHRYLKNTQMENHATPLPEHIHASWSLTPLNDKTLNLASIGSVTWQMKAFDAAAGNDGIEVQAALFVASDAEFTDILLQATATTSANHDTGAPSGEVVFSQTNGLLSTSQTLYFGLAFTDNSSISDKDIRFDDLTIHGSVGLPATDSDGDGLSDEEERSGLFNTAFGKAASDPQEADSDGDGFDDFRELTNEPATNPNDRSSRLSRVTFVNASLVNTTLLDGSDLQQNAHYRTYPEGIVPGANSLDHRWNIRSPWANGGEVMSSGDSGLEDAPTLTLTMGELERGQLYEVFAYFWAADEGTQAWDFQSGFDKGSLTLSNPSRNATDLSSFDDNPSTYFTHAVDCQEGNRELYEIFIGYALADENGHITVSVDDTPDTDHRTWFDGTGHRISFLDLTPGADHDGDGLDNASEIHEHGTHPEQVDSDLDGLNDDAEILIHNTNPLNADSDEDGFGDRSEITANTNPNDAGKTPYQIVASDGVWTWFNDERAIWHLGKLYTGYVLSDGRYGISQYDPDLRTRQETIISTNTSRQNDDHNNPSISILPDNTLLILYAKHSSENRFYWRKSIVPEPSSLADWSEEKSQEVSDRYTYNNTYLLSAENNRIYNFHREIGWDPTLMYSDDNGDTWSESHLVIDSGGNGRRPYPKYWSNNENRIDFIYTDGHPDETDTGIYHLYYESGPTVGTGAFKQSDGTVLKTLPQIFAGDAIDHDGDQIGATRVEHGSMVYQYRPAGTNYERGEDQHDFLPGGRAWTWDICYQENGHPVCAFQVQQNNGSHLNDRIQYYYAAWDGKEWQKKLIAQGGRPIYNSQRYYGGGLAIDPEHPNVVYLSSNHRDPFDLNLSHTKLNATQRYEIYRGMTRDGGQSFTWQAITTDSEQDNLRPIVPDNHGYDQHVIWFHGRYSSYTNFQTQVLALTKKEEKEAIQINDYGFETESLFFIDVQGNDRNRRVTTATDLNFTQASHIPATVEPLASGETRFAFEVSGAKRFFRIERE